MQETEWIVKKVPEGFCPEGGPGDLPAILRLLLAQRGYVEEDELEAFLRPRLRDLGDPFELPEMDAAVERILQAVEDGEITCVFGDYDVDGITSVTILRTILCAYGLEPQTFIPVRGEEGYGLSDAAIDRCLGARERPSLMITVDCGTASGSQIERLQGTGIDVIVVDHHEPGLAGRPPAVAVVNPKLGEDYGYLCSAGVVFKLAHALLKARPLEGVDLRNLLDLVAVATIADIVPLLGENRLLVRHGLKRLQGTLNHGLRALMEVSGMNGHATSSDVGFRIGPRINAAGRMDAPDDALAALMTDSRKVAKSLAEQLDAYNRQRQKHEQQMFEQAMAQLDDGFDKERDPVIVVGSRDWHPGVVGIVASRLMRYFHKPSFVVSFDEEGMGKGSGRSIEGVSLVEVIDACRPVLEAGGGHHMAAGISVREDKLAEFGEAFGAFVLEHTTADQRRQRVHIDAEVPFSELSLEFLSSYELLQPFGPGNPQPVFMSRGVWLTESPRRLKNRHLRLSLRQGIHEHDAMFFGAGDRELPDPPWDIAFTIDRNVFRGRTSLQISVREIRAVQ
ncbi:MAG: single-stranded-DNA-specific exonuclease RecJ [Akkermansiaceae bacterium]|nr:single-stranded-DNA-specific exonuclease RecJ [Akkermansiaceae bacterium]